MRDPVDHADKLGDLTATYDDSPLDDREPHA